MHLDQLIAARCAPQLGLVTSAQLAEIGLSDDQVWRRTQSGLLERRQPHVFALAGAPRTWEQDVMAACLSAGPGTAASHRSAARLLGVDLRLDVPVEITSTRPQALKLNDVVTHRSTDLVPEHCREISGILVTNEHRLLVDLGGVVPWWVVSRALETLVAQRRVTPKSVERFLGDIARRGRNGVGVLREVLERRALGVEVSDSGLEVLFAGICQAAGLPAPDFQYAIRLDGRWRRIDFCYPELLIAIEIDGYEAHTRFDVFDDDRVRGNELELRGWLVLRFTRMQIEQREGYVVRTIRRAIEARAAEMRAS